MSAVARARTRAFCFAGGEMRLIRSVRRCSQRSRVVPMLLPGPANMAPEARAAASVIEIELAGGHRLRADASVDAALLRSVIEVLVGR